MTVGTARRIAAAILLCLASFPVAHAGNDTIVRFKLAAPTIDALEPGGEELGPNANPNDDYARILRTAFAEAFPDQVRAREIWEAPMPGQEGAIWIGAYGSHFEIRSLKSTRWLWNYSADGLEQARQHREILRPADFRKVTLKKCQVRLDLGLALQVISAWKQMLMAVQHADHRTILFDKGEQYYSLTSGGRFLSGDIGYSDGGLPRPKADHLSYAATEMKDYCSSKSRRIWRH